MFLLIKKIPFELVEVKDAPPEPHLPRPELDLMGITYRKIPLLVSMSLWSLYVSTSSNLTAAVDFCRA